MSSGGKLSFVRLVYMAAIAVAILIPFQNCGQDYSTEKSYFTGQDYESSDCLSDVVDCQPQPNFLQISIDLSDPANFHGLSEAQISGRCNTGDYPQHYIHWEISGATSAIEASGDVTGICVDGLYSFIAPLTNAAAGQLHTIEVKIIGVTDGEKYQNLGTNGSASIDFTR